MKKKTIFNKKIDLNAMSEKNKKLAIISMMIISLIFFVYIMFRTFTIQGNKQEIRQQEQVQEQLQGNANKTNTFQKAFYGAISPLKKNLSIDKLYDAFSLFVANRELQSDDTNKDSTQIKSLINKIKTYKRTYNEEDKQEKQKL